MIKGEPMKLILIALLFLTGCSVNVEKKDPQKVVYVSTPLQLPTKPQYPKVKGNDLDCLSDPTKRELLNRDIVMKNYIGDLETVILSTQKNK